MWRIEFFEVMAQIGPVLLIAYALEERFMRSAEPEDPSNEAASIAGIWTWYLTAVRLAGLASVFIAELVALAVTAGAWEPQPQNGYRTAALMLFGMSYIPLALGFPPRSRRDGASAMIASAMFLVPGSLFLWGSLTVATT